MNYTNTELSGKQISKIGLGCVTFGREIGRSASFDMMDYAYECGITLFDTAAAYGAGSSEAIVGEWIAAHRPESDSMVVATKTLPPYDRENITESVSQSLCRLGVDTIDLLYLHRFDNSLMAPEIFATLGDLIIQGKVRMLGASNFTAEQLAMAVSLQKENDLPFFRFVQNNNNLAVTDVSDELINLCSENSISIITYSPLAAGFLTGKYKRGIQQGTRFDIIPGHKDVYFNDTANSRLEHLQMMAARTGYSPVHLALAWAMHQSYTTSVLIGGRKPAHIDQALVAMDFDAPDIIEQLTTS